MKAAYKARSLAGAERRVRELLAQIEEWRKIVERLEAEGKMLAKLAAKGPAFFNPLEAMAAEKVRDEILSRMGMKPDGSFGATTGSENAPR